jgi:hypothetical protein
MSFKTALLWFFFFLKRKGNECGNNLKIDYDKYADENTAKKT